MYEQKKIFVIADKPDIVIQLGEQIKILGFKLAGSAKTVEDAIQIIDKLKPDFVIIDVEHKADIDEISIIIKDNFSIPVILLLDKSNAVIIQNSFKSGSCGYIAKPSTTATLNTAILNSLNLHKTERRISNREEQLKSILSSLDSNICVLDETGTIIMTNDHWEKFAADNSTAAGRTGVGVNYLQICENTQGEDRQTALEFASGIREVIQGLRKNFYKEYACNSPDEVRWFRGKVTPLPDRSRATNGAVISHVNITEYKKLEKEMIEKTSLFNSIMDTTSDAIFVKDLNGRYLLLNKSAANFVGRNAADVLGRDDMSIFKEEEATVIMEADREVIENGKVETCEQSLTVASEKIITFQTTKGLVSGINGEKIGIFGISRDISQLVKDKEALERSKQVFLTMVENATDTIIRYDKNFRYVYCNKEVERGYGISVTDMIGKTPMDIALKEEEFKSLIESLRKVFINGKEDLDEQKFILPAGEKWFQRRIIPERNKNGEIETLLVIGRDITEYKRAMNEIKEYQNHLEDLIKKRTKDLLESETRYKEIVNSITDYVYQVKIDENKKVSIIYNDRCFAVTGYHSSEFEEDNFLWLNLVYEEDQVMFTDCIMNILSGEENFEKNIEHRIITKDGSLRWIKNNMVIHKNQDGVLTGYDGVIRDITDLKIAEDEIKQLNINIVNLQEEERQRVAENLHDSVGQTLLAAKLNIDTYKQDPVYFEDQLNAGISFIIQASNELREIYTNLYPTVLNDLGFEMAIRWLVDNTLTKMNIKTEIHSSLKTRQPHNIEVAFYRITQEIISNILKHASATSVYMYMASNENFCELIVKDDGIGFNPDKRKDKISGYGLANIKNRVIGFGGKFSIESNYPHGTVINITIGLHR